MKIGSFSIEILVEGQPLEEVFHPSINKTFVEGPPGKFFIVKVTNFTDG